MKKYSCILLDFDGTIMDTSEGIKKSFDKVVEYFNLNIPDKSIYNKMIGPPLKESFRNVFYIKESELDKAVEVYRSYYSQIGMYEATPYSGLCNLLKELRGKGKKLFVATSKPEVYTRSILEKKDMLNLFDFVGGSDLEEKKRVNKVDVIRYVLSVNNIEEKNECVMVGDTFYDINGAKSVGIDSIGVLYGFGTKDSLQSSCANYIVNNVQELSCLLNNI